MLDICNYNSSSVRFTRQVTEQTKAVPIICLLYFAVGYMCFDVVWCVCVLFYYDFVMLCVLCLACKSVDI